MGKLSLDLETLIKKIIKLQRLREKLLTKNLALKDTWIQQYTVIKTYPDSPIVNSYTYAKWEAAEPIFKCKLKKNKLKKYTKHQHIGRVSSSTGLGMENVVKEAYKGLRNRRWLSRIELALSKIEAAIIDF